MTENESIILANVEAITDHVAATAALPEAAALTVGLNALISRHSTADALMALATVMTTFAEDRASGDITRELILLVIVELLERAAEGREVWSRMADDE